MGSTSRWDKNLPKCQTDMTECGIKKGKLAYNVAGWRNGTLIKLTNIWQSIRGKLDLSLKEREVRNLLKFGLELLLFRHCSVWWSTTAIANKINRKKRKEIIFSCLSYQAPALSLYFLEATSLHTQTTKTNVCLLFYPLTVSSSQCFYLLYLGAVCVASVRKVINF